LIQIIDGNIIVALHNDTNEDKIIKAGERIAQLVIIPYLPINLQLADKLDETERGINGFGSTGV
jgi:dUTP pyrophosphatase